MRADSSSPFFCCAAFGRTFCGVLLLAVAGNALSLPGKRFVGRYDFGYAIRGDKPARPAQVFDDGSGKVYFEARANQPMPAVFAGSDPVLLVLQPEGQYFTARTSEREFTLVLGDARARVQRGGDALGEETVEPQGEGARLLASADPGLTPGVDYGSPTPVTVARRLVHEQPVVFAPGSSALKPEVLEALSALVLRIDGDATITAVGRNDVGLRDTLATLRAEALRNALLARGIAAARIRLGDDEAVAPAHSRASMLRWSSSVEATESARAGAALSFDIAPADRDIAVSLRRWAAASGYDIAWDVDWVAPVNGAMHIEAASFLDAVGQVVAGLRARGYPVQARTAGDRIVRFGASE